MGFPLFTPRTKRKYKNLPLESIDFKEQYIHWTNYSYCPSIAVTTSHIYNLLSADVLNYELFLQTEINYCWT